MSLPKRLKIDSKLQADKNTRLHLAAEAGDHLEVSKLLYKISSDPRSVNIHGDTPLHLAAKNSSKSSHYEVLKKLLIHKSDPNVKNHAGKSPFHYCLLKEGIKVVKLFIEHGAKVNQERFSEDSSPLYLASHNCDYEVMKLLLKLGADVNSRDTNNVSVLYKIAQKKIYNSNMEFVKLLLQNGADPNILDSTECLKVVTDFFVNNRSLETNNLLTHLLTYGADINRMSFLTKTVVFECGVGFRNSRIIIYAYLIKLKELKLPISKEIYQKLIKNCPSLRHLFDSCVSEIRESKLKTILGKITYYDLIISDENRITKFAGNMELIEVFKRSNSEEIFPIYSAFMTCNLNKGIARRKIEKKASLVFKLYIYPLNELLLKEKIFCFLSLKDLNSLYNFIL